MTEINKKFQDMLRNVAMNRVERQDQELALNILASFALDKAIDIHPCVEMGISLGVYSSIQVHILAGRKSTAVREMREANGCSLKDALAFVESSRFKQREAAKQGA